MRDGECLDSMLIWQSSPVSRNMQNDNILWETEHWKVILAEDQAYLGRGVIVLKRRPCTSLPELCDDELLDLKNNVMTPYEAAVKKAFGAEMFNWSCFMNDAYQNNPPDPHMHWHVRPRYRHSVTVEGEVFADDKFGHHYTPLTMRIVSPELRKTIADRLCEAWTQL